MGPQRRQILVETAKIFDLLSVIFSFLLATSLVDLPAEKVILSQFLAMRVKVQNGILFLGFILLWDIIFNHYDLYDPDSRRLSSFWNDLFDILTATSLGTMSLFFLSMLFNIRMVNNMFLVVFWAAIFTLVFLSKMIMRYGLRWFRIKGMNLRNIVFVGINHRAICLAQKIISRPQLGYRLAGFVDNTIMNFQEFKKNEFTQISDFNSFPEYLRCHVVDEVVICLPMKSYYQQAESIASLCEEHGITVRLLSDLFNLKLAHSKAEQFEGYSVNTLYTGHMVGGGIIVKRAIDFILSLLLIIILSPLLLVVAILIKLTSNNGPVFFSQERMGINKHRFNVYKFRTMHPDAEKRLAELEHLNEVSGPVFKIKNDPRLTIIGKFLRKTSIDELPQLFNVLKGDMSLVGPRPLPVRDYEGFGHDWHRRRFSVLPGITCTWQISGRSNITFDRWMELDMEYIDNWSLLLDLKILLGTIPAVLKGSGAS